MGMYNSVTNGADATNRPTEVPIMSNTDYTLTEAAITGIFGHHGISVATRREGSSVAFTAVDRKGRGRACWANLGGLTVGGRGRLAGTLTKALCAIAAELVA